MVERVVHAHGAPRLTRSPTHLLTLVAGLVLTGLGWGIATLFTDSIVAITGDVQDLIAPLPVWARSVPATTVELGALGAFVGTTIWLVWTRRPRDLALVYVAAAAAAATSALAGEGLVRVLEPDIRRLFDDLPRDISRFGPTDLSVAAVTAVLTLVRRWIPPGSRRVVFSLFVASLGASILSVSAPPHLGLVLDLGIGLVVGSVVALVFKIPSLQPGPSVIIAGLARSGLHVATLEAAAVDARGSKPWTGTTTNGEPVFVKALSVEQRAADLLYRGLRWAQLRRGGDPPPESSLKRAAEHEALVAHHVRTFGLPTPRLLAVADLGDSSVVLAYEGMEGQSLDRVDPATIDDDTLDEVWRHVALLHEHGVAHRDLRLANVFRRGDGSTMLIDFGFAELAAEPDLLDADVAELLAGSAALVGVSRAVAAADRGLGREALEEARAWLHPLALSRATRSMVSEGPLLAELRTEVERATGHSVTPYEPIGRLSLQRLVGLALIVVGVYLLLAVINGRNWWPMVRRLDWSLIGSALVLSAVTYPLVGGAARSLSKGQLPIRAATTAALAAIVPVSAPTPWARASAELSDTARQVGLAHRSTKPLASACLLTGLATAPLVVAVVAATGLRGDHGLTAASLMGLGLGTMLALAQVLLIVVTPWGRELQRVWIQEHLSTIRGGAPLISSAVWWMGARFTQGVAMALSMRAVGVEIPLGSLAALGIVAASLASLTPAPGGIGATEAVLYFGLVALGEEHLAGAGMVVARLTTFWTHLPVALFAFRTSNSRRRSSEAATDRGLG